MSRRRNRRAPPRSSAKEYAERVPQDVRIAYTELLGALSRADSQAVDVSRATGISHDQVVDLHEASNILSRYPQLSTFLTNMKQREDAKQLALRPDLALKAPTGSTPQASPIASGWRSEERRVG